MIRQFLKKFCKQGLHLPPQEVCEFTGNDVASTELSMNTYGSSAIISKHLSQDKA